MGKVISAFWKKYQVWPELCPKQTLFDGERPYKHSCLECLIDGKILCDPELRLTRGSQENSKVNISHLQNFRLSFSLSISFSVSVLGPYVESLGRKRRPRVGKWRQCPVCKSWFYVPKWLTLKGKGVFCCHKCAGRVKGCPAGVSIEQYADFKKMKKREDIDNVSGVLGI